MKKVFKFISKYGISIVACAVMAFLCLVSYQAMGSPGEEDLTSIGQNIGIPGDLTVDGNVGIGTADPQAKLDVDGDIRINGNDLVYIEDMWIDGYDGYIKYSNGYMEQWGFDAHGDADTEYEWNFFTQDFHEAFAERPWVECTWMHRSDQMSGEGFWQFGVEELSTTNFTCGFWDEGGTSNMSGSEAGIKWQARGKWQ